MTSPLFRIPLDDVEKVFEEVDNPGIPEGEDREDSIPSVMLKDWKKEDYDKLAIWLDNWIVDLKTAHDKKLTEWTEQETAYRAADEGPLEEPFVGAPGHVVPLAAMAVDPIVARLDTGVFKTSPVFVFKGLKKSYLSYISSIEAWVEYYQRHQLKLRQTIVPRLFEFTKHGTMVLKVVHHRQVCDGKRYNRKAGWKLEDYKYTTYDGPQIFGVSIKDFMFPPHYQYLQDCPIVVERHRTTYNELLTRQTSGEITNVEKLIDQENGNVLNELELARAQGSNYIDPGHQNRFIEVYEIWADYFYKGKHYKLAIMYHRDTQTFLSVRLNYYFHQKKPYVLIPYTVTNDSLWGIGIVEMVLAFQKMLTMWDRSALANAMLANVRMLITTKDAEIEARPKFYTGRVFRVEDPSKHLIPFSPAQDVYPSTLTERQNIIGLAEKRTGVSDYLTGRESPIIGSRATATSTLALIQEGTRRVEEVMENLRAGLAEAMQFCISDWIQFGIGGVKDIVFGDDEIGVKVTQFFDQIDADNINGMMAIDLAATDAANNRSVQQQVQLAIIQVMMTYLKQLVEVGKLAVESAASAPQLAELIGEVMTSARNMFKELLTRYDIRNPEEYLPDLENFLAGIGIGGSSGPEGQAAPAPSRSNVPNLTLSRGVPTPGPAQPAIPGSGSNNAAPPTGSYPGV